MSTIWNDFLSLRQSVTKNNQHGSEQKQLNEYFKTTKRSQT